LSAQGSSCTSMGSIKLATNAELAGENDKISILTVVSPDTELNLKPSTCTLRTYMQLFKKTESLLDVMRSQSASDLEKLMRLSKKLADSHVQRFKAFERLPPKQAVLLFGGKAIGADDFDEDDQKYAQSHLRMVSGLYGVLRPYDDVRGVRDIPMGASLHTSRGESLLDFWGDAIRKQLAKDVAAIDGDSSRALLLGCMGEDSWRAVQPEMLPEGVVARRVSFVSDDEKDVRRAYGLLARYIVRYRVEDLASLKNFDRDDWAFESSSDTTFVFARRRGNLASVSLSGKDGPGKKEKKSKKRSSSPSSAGSSPSRRKRKARSQSRGRKARSPSRGRKARSSSRGRGRKRERESRSESPDRRKASRRDSKKKARARSSSSS